MAVPTPPRTNGFAEQLLGLDADACLARHDVLQVLVDVGLDEILYAPRADQRQDMTVYAACVGYDRRRLLRAPAFSQYEARLQIIEIEVA